MSTKANEIQQDDSVWNKAADDEPLFILRATDPLAPHVINVWIAIASMTDLATRGLKDKGTHSINDTKIQSAIDLRNRMIGWQGEYPNKVKMPD